MTKKVKEMYEDIGMSFGLEKCASLHIVRGKVSKSEDLPIGAKDSISAMQPSDTYKFLGKYENFEQLDMFTFQQAEIGVSTKIECYMDITPVSAKKTDS